MPVILQVNFTPGEKHNRQSQQEIVESAGPLVAVKGLRWKIWINNQKESLRGGIYLFDDQTSAEAWGEGQIRPNLIQAGAADILLRYFSVNEAPSRITRAPLDWPVQG